MSTKVWDVFISHASEDKEGVARPLARLLEKSGLKVWLDESELCLGDSLREKIDEGLARSKYGIVILSRHFFSKKWPKAELDGLFSRETEGMKVILPVWHEVDESDVNKFSPLLSSRLATKTKAGLDDVCKTICKAIGRSDDKSQGNETQVVSSGQITSEIQFSSLLNPDDVSIELMFQAFFDAAAKVVPVGPSSIRLPQDADSSIRFRDSVNDVAIVINWPVEITRMIPMLDDLIREVRNHGDHNSRFHSQNTEWLASCLRDLTRTRSWIQEVLVGLPKRLPWLWLSILEYASPFPDKWNSTFRVQQNYLRFASLMLYRRLLNTINYVLPEFRADPPFDNERILGPRWEYSFPVLFSQEDDLVVAYVTDIDGFDHSDLDRELCIYGPEKLTRWAYEQSLKRKPITCPWFMAWLVPQVELLYAERKPDKRTSYCERARIRKIESAVPVQIYLPEGETKKDDV